MSQQKVDLLLARAQIGFFVLFALGIFALVFVLIFFNSMITTAVLTIITTVITALVTIMTLMANFFYARTRPQALPDPSTTSTTTTTVTGPSPTEVPAGSAIIEAPKTPQAIITPKS